MRKLPFQQFYVIRNYGINIILHPSPAYILPSKMVQLANLNLYIALKQNFTKNRNFQLKNKHF
jgi:hypothetical protein